MSTATRLNRTLFTAPLRTPDAEELVAQLLGEDIELVLDARPAPDAALAAACAAHATHYVHQPALARHAAPDEARAAATAAAPLALRHHTCVLAEEIERTRVAETIAGVVGMRVLDLAASPAPVTTATLASPR